VSTTVSKHQNFVGGEWVDASGGETMEVLQSWTDLRHVSVSVSDTNRSQQFRLGSGTTSVPTHFRHGV
jgi:hypothetical protein